MSRNDDRWIRINSPWNIESDRIVSVVRRIVSEGIPIQLESNNRFYMNVYVKRDSMRRIWEIFEEVRDKHDTINEVSDTLVLGDVNQDSIEIRPAGNRIKVYGDSSDVEKFKEKIDAMMVLQDYATREYERKAEVRRRAPKSRT